MLAPDSCRNCPIRLLQRCWRILIILPLAISVIVLNVETFAEETNGKSASPSVQTKAAPVNSKPAQSADNAAEKRSETPSSNTDSAKTSKKAPAANDANDKDEAPDPAEMLNVIRKNYAKKTGADNLKDDLIISQSSFSIFLNRKKIRDVTENILNHWCLSSFEDDFNLTRIEFEAVDLKQSEIDLESDIESQLLLYDDDCPMVNSSDVSRTLNSFINFPLPKSFVDFLTDFYEENSVVDAPTFIPESISLSSILVLFIGLLGFSLLGYTIYRIVVWAFMLDQNWEYDLQKGRNEDVVAPVSMDAFREYYFQTGVDNKKK